MPWDTHRLGAVCLCEGIEHRQRSDAVHHGMVHLEEARRPAVLEPFDQVGFPQRPHVIERRGKHRPDEVQQVTLGRRFWKDHLAGMIVDLEVRVVFPLRETKAQGRLDHPLAQPGEARDPPFHGGTQAIVVRAPVQDHHRSHQRTQLRRRFLDVPEECVGGQHARGELQWIMKVICRGHGSPPAS